MLIAVRFNPAELYEIVHEIIRMAFPGGRLTRDENQWGQAKVRFVLELTQQEDNWKLFGHLESMERQAARTATIYQVDEGINPFLQQLRFEIKIFSLQLLREYLSRRLTRYGILTGVRPTKIVHRWLDQGCSKRQITQGLKVKYLLDEEKAELLTEVAENNHDYLTPMHAEDCRVSIYIGIPYCPSRCYYCSFPGVVMKNYEEDIRPFVDHLYREMNSIGDYLKDTGAIVQTIYIGGGTPSILTSQDLSLILELLEKKYDLRQAEEITVEAGRPDTLSREKIQLFKEAGVNRICINPQTMNNSTLALIGRKHDCQQVIQAADLVRQAGIKHLNMDLIVGLPGESIDDNMASLEAVLQLEPENITVHTLALKRGSPMALDRENGIILWRTELAEEILDRISQRLRQEEYLPYYLYRQKNMQANTENIGYSKAGSFCVYNIQMIEERQTIIGMGGGAGSKFINSRQGTVTGFYNPKNPAVYCAEIERLIDRKVDNLRALN